MKLYFSPGTCTLATRVALIEAGLPFDSVAVDLHQRVIAGGQAFKQVNGKGNVPVLELDDGRRYTENVAILDWISVRCPRLLPAGEDGRTRSIEMLAFIASEVHKQFTRFYFPTCDEEKAQATKKIGQRFRWLAGEVQHEHVLGPQFGVADAYLYVMLVWGVQAGIELPPALQGLKQRLDARPAVQAALKAEAQPPLD